MRKDEIRHTVLHFLDEPELTRKIRILSVVGFLLGVLVLTLELTGIMNANSIKKSTDLVILFLFLLQFVYPRRPWFLAINTILAGGINIYFGGNILGFLFYVFGLSVLLKQGWFRTGKRFKLPLSAAVLTGLTLTQLFNFSLQRFTITSINILIAAGLIFGFLYLFHGNLKVFYHEKPLLILNGLGLSERQRECFLACLQGKRIKEIAEQLIISESVIKKEMQVIYERLGVQDFHELRNRLENSTVQVG